MPSQGQDLRGSRRLARGSERPTRARPSRERGERPCGPPISTRTKLQALAGGGGASRPAGSTFSTNRPIGSFSKETGGIDALFNCAGFVHHGSVLDAHRRSVGFRFQPQRPQHVLDDPGVSCPAC